MNCPFCKKEIYGLTGFIEAQKFQKHLGVCRKNPNRYETKDGTQTVIQVGKTSLADALAIRAESGQ